MVPPEAAAGRDEWDRHWALYGEPAHGNPANAYRHRLVLELLGHPGPGDTIVDIGSGQGELALLLHETFPAATVAGHRVQRRRRGRRAQSRGTRRGLAVEFAQRDLLQPADVDPPWRGGAGYAVCSEVLEHVDDPGLLLRNAAAYLAPGCRLVVTVPGGPRSAFDRHIGHRQHFAPATLRRVLAGGGLRRRVVARAGFPFFNLYRLAVIARGRRLIADLERSPAEARPGTQGAVLAFFDRAFRLNLPSSPFGWQMVAVARLSGSGPTAVIISRTPLRITLGGGGTDLPSYYEEHGGFVISAAINRYIFIAINRTFGDDYFLKYSELERVSHTSTTSRTPSSARPCACTPSGPPSSL